MSIDLFSNEQLVISDLPQFQQIKYSPLARVAPWEPFWQSVFTLSLLLLILIVSSVFNPYITFKMGMYVFIVLMVIFTLSQWHNFKEHKLRGVAVRELDIVFKKGLFWRKKTLLPFKRVQHMEIHRNPIERKLGLSSLKIFTAGGTGVDLKISGLESETAENIKQYILEQTKAEQTKAEQDVSAQDDSSV